ncbi:hypothetical protein [Salinibacterium sp. ZJ450]|uniref:hypothetical protein n=1 Tax=Salinibacterium sp. ZJ450 TaxID=2708338 RepID=UPI00142126C9|nr:hypothetical protein [Salinibacterium sp. ZJ450]
MTAARDFGAMLEFGSWGARLLLVLFVVVHTMIALSSLRSAESTWPSLVALVLVCSAAVVSIHPAPAKLGLWRTLVIVAAVVASTVVVCTQLPLTGPISYAAWYLGADTFLLMLLALRGRIGWAWAGFALMGAITLGWVAWSGRGVLDSLELVARHAATLFIGSLVAVMLRRTAQRIARFHAIEERRATDEAVARASLDERRTRIARVEAIARPMLETIASGRPLDAAERDECRVIEATLRDSVRARLLSTATLDAAVIGARRRGVAVTLLDDRATPLTDFDGERMSEWVTDKLESTLTGSAVVRLLPAGRASLATVVVEDGTEPSVHHLRCEGEPAPGGG